MLGPDAQVVILCGGFGTRIRDVTEDIPKAMIPIGGKPILWHIMRGYAHYGYRRFVLCLGHRSWQIKRYFLDYLWANSDLTIHLKAPEQVAVSSPTLEEDWEVTMAETGLDAMTGCRVKRVEKYIDCDNFFLTYGDGVANVDLDALAEFHLAHGKLGTVTAVSPPGRFGELSLEGNCVTEFAEKPLQSESRINGGFFVFRREFLHRLKDDPKLVLEQGPLVSLARDRHLMNYCHDGFWQCMDNSREFQLLNELWQSGNAPWNVWQPAPLRMVA
jgi:glucose-1-phosphate cytidylyltransferase